MIKRTQQTIYLLLFGALASLLGSFMYTPASYAACGDERLLTLPAWYRGLVEPGSGGTCEIKDPSSNLSQFFSTLAVNIVEILLHIVAYVAVAFIIIGGFKYITSAGSPDANEKGRKTILNAVIGLVISIASIGIVNLILV